MKILTVFGTRPEAIKMAPLIQILNNTEGIDHKVCSTGQHRQMLAHVLDFFEIVPDFDLDIMKQGQDLTDITVGILLGLKKVFQEFTPDWILVHGDTTTCLAASMSAFYAGIKIGHVEAGLRTGDIRSPFPEEANRIITDRLSSVYFVPTLKNRENLLRENIDPDKIILTGNTVIDALLWATGKVNRFSEEVPARIVEAYNKHERIILVTGHRRENFGQGFDEICKALIALSVQNPEVGIVYPVHLNPQVLKPVYDQLAGIPNIYLTPPMDYADFIFAMKNSWLILTDSGGIQEEAPSLGKPVLVMRESTERPEAVESGSVLLVGADSGRIIEGVRNLLNDPELYAVMSKTTNPYGDGQASERIVHFLTGLSDRKTVPAFNM